MIRTSDLSPRSRLRLRPLTPTHRPVVASLKYKKREEEEEKRESDDGMGRKRNGWEVKWKGGGGGGVPDWVRMEDQAATHADDNQERAERETVLLDKKYTLF